MNTKEMNQEIAIFEQRFATSLADFMNRAKKGILCIRIADACSCPIVEAYILGSELSDEQLRTCFAVSMKFDLNGRTRYGQVLQRRLTFWLCEPCEENMKSHGMDRDDFVLCDPKMDGCLFGKTMTEAAALESNLPFITVTDSITLPNLNPSSFVKQVPSTSYQLVKYLKTFTPEALYAYIQDAKIPYDLED